MVDVRDRLMTLEADVVVNGIELSEEESMVLRIAVENYIHELDHPFGDDERFAAIKDLYLVNLRTVRSKMFDN